RAGGEVLLEADALTEGTLVVRLGDLVYGPDRAPSLRAFDEARRRAEPAEGCTHIHYGNLYVCEAVSLAQLEGKPVSVVVLGWSRRAFQALYESRRQLLKLTLFLLALGLLLAWWIGRRMVGPVEALRDE